RGDRGGPAALLPQGRIRVDRLQQTLLDDGAEGLRPDQPARALQPRLPRLGDDDDRGDLLRRHRPPALVQLAAEGALRGRTETGAEKRRPAVLSPTGGDGRER